MIYHNIFTTTGSKHENNGEFSEDFIIGGRINTYQHYIIFSDGCSGIDGLSDVGARIWSLSLKQILLDKCNYNFLNNKSELPIFLNIDILNELVELFKNNNLSIATASEFATVGCALLVKDKIQFFLMGDGGYAIHHQNGNITFVHFDWLNNKPFYPAYKLLNEDEYNLVIKNFVLKSNTPIRKTIKEYKPVKNLFGKIKFVLVNAITENIDFEVFENGFLEHISIKKAKSFSVYSDGLLSFNNLTDDQIIKNFLINPYTNKPLQRIEILKNYNKLKNKNIYPNDDLSIGTIIF